MSSKPRRNETKELHAIPSQEAETGETSPGRSVRDEKIRRRACEIYLERGEQPGSEREDCQAGGLAPLSVNSNVDDFLRVGGSAAATVFGLAKMGCGVFVLV